MSFLSCSNCSEGDLRDSVSGGQFKFFVAEGGEALQCCI